MFTLTQIVLSLRSVTKQIGQLWNILHQFYVSFEIHRHWFHEWVRMCVLAGVAIFILQVFPRIQMKRWHQGQDEFTFIEETRCLLKRNMNYNLFFSWSRNLKRPNWKKSSGTSVPQRCSTFFGVSWRQVLWPASGNWPPETIVNRQHPSSTRSWFLRRLVLLWLSRKSPLVTYRSAGDQRSLASCNC